MFGKVLFFVGYTRKKCHYSDISFGKSVNIFLQVTEKILGFCMAAKWKYARLKWRVASFKIQILYCVYSYLSYISDL